MKRSLGIDENRLASINAFLERSPNAVLDPLLEIIEKFGGAERINEKARENGTLDSLLKRLRKANADYARQLEWLVEQRDAGRFIPMEEYAAARGPAGAKQLDSSYRVTLEISALQYFPWLIAEARRAID
jgi:hypothetical protein